MDEKKTEQTSSGSLLGALCEDLERVFGKESAFFEHMTQSKLEFMKGLRSMLDARIENLEKKRAGNSGQKMTKIKVE